MKGFLLPGLAAVLLLAMAAPCCAVDVALSSSGTVVEKDTLRDADDLEDGVFDAIDGNDTTLVWGDRIFSSYAAEGNLYSSEFVLKFNPPEGRGSPAVERLEILWYNGGSNFASEDWQVSYEDTAGACTPCTV